MAKKSKKPRKEIKARAKKTASKKKPAAKKYLPRKKIRKAASKAALRFKAMPPEIITTGEKAGAEKPEVIPKIKDTIPASTIKRGSARTKLNLAEDPDDKGNQIHE